MENKIALVTGSTGGIGQALCEHLAQKGWHLILLNRSVQKTNDQKRSLDEAFPEQEFYAYHADLMELHDLEIALNKISDKFQRLNAVFNVAGFLSDKRVMNSKNIEAHFAINTIAPYLILKRLKPLLTSPETSNQRSMIVNFSSEVALKVKQFQIDTLANPENIGGLMGAYAKSKLAMNILSKCVELSLDDLNISIFSVDPGPTKSPMTDSGDGMPWFIKLIRPLVFQPAPKQVDKLFACLEEALQDQQTGLFISNGRVRNDHRLATSREIQKELKALIEALIYE